MTTAIATIIEQPFHRIKLHFISLIYKIKARTMDPEKLNSIYSKAVCSPTITRQNLSRKILIPSTIDNKNDEDDAEFFEILKRKINASSIKNLQIMYESNKSYATRKKKHNFHEETTNVIKRFKETIEHKNHIEENTIKLHSQSKNSCEDNTTICTYNNNAEQSININANDECYALPRNFTIIFQPEKPSANEETNRSEFMKSNNMNEI